MVSENRVMLGGHLHSTVVASLYFGLAIAACGAALALAGPTPRLTRDQRLAGGVAAVALFGLASDVASYAASVAPVVVAQQPGRFQRFLRGGPPVWLGHVSYSLYLVHVPVLVASMAVLRGTSPLWASLVAGVAASLAATEAMRRLAAVPSRNLARWAERGLRRPDPDRAAAGRQEAGRWGRARAACSAIWAAAAGADAPASGSVPGAARA